MVQQFKSSGVPLFKASGVPAMDPNCCCDEAVCDWCGDNGTWNVLRIALVWDPDTIGFDCEFWNGNVVNGFIDVLGSGPNCEFTTLPINCEFPITTYPNITINYDGGLSQLQIEMNLAADETISGSEFTTCPPTGGVFYDEILGVTITVEHLTF